MRPSADLLSVPVHKRRAHYTVGGCTAELTEVRTGALTTRTLAVEDEDPALVRATVEKLGLWSRPNVSFPRGLEALVGFGATTYAVVDVGTNSVKFHLGERAADGAWRQLVDRAEVTRLGEGLDDSAVSSRRRWSGRSTRLPGWPTRHGRTRQRRSPRSERRGCGPRPTALSSSTPCTRAAAFASRSSAATRKPGSRTSPRQPASVPSTGSLVVFETGGGSTQFTFGHGDRVDEQFSVDVGAVRFTERFGLDGVVDDRRWPRRSTRLQESSGRSTDARRPTRWWGWAEP